MGNAPTPNIPSRDSKRRNDRLLSPDCRANMAGNCAIWHIRYSKISCTDPITAFGHVTETLVSTEDPGLVL